jgi:hypothetical protein
MQGNHQGTAKSSLLYEAFVKTMGAVDRLPAAVSDMEGMSGQSYRLFVNNLVSATDAANYLEIGSWAGSTVAAALYGNTAHALCIDNWSQFGGPKDEFLDNCKKLQLKHRIDLLEDDFRNVDYSAFGPFDIYLYDGPHEEEDHHDGIVRVQPALEDEYFLIVDDWNWPGVRIGTLRGLSATKSTILFAIEVRTTEDNEHPAGGGKDSAWHNGCLLAVIAKKT